MGENPCTDEAWSVRPAADHIRRAADEVGHDRQAQAALAVLEVVREGEVQFDAVGRIVGRQLLEDGEAVVPDLSMGVVGALAHHGGRIEPRKVMGGSTTYM